MFINRKALTILPFIVPFTTILANQPQGGGVGEQQKYPEAEAPMMVRRPKQGVFLLSNQPTNEVGVYESLDDGSLSWVGRYATGGIGYPDPTDMDNFNDLGGSNAIHYHVWNKEQFIVVANAGGPQGESSVSLMKIVDPSTLHLVLVDKVDLNGVFAYSVASYQDRVCAVTCAGSVTMECFRIETVTAATTTATTTTSEASSSSAMLTTTFTLQRQFEYDFGGNIPPREGRPNAASAAYGPGNILFSGDGLQVGIVMKGDAGLTDEQLEVYSAPQAGFVSFPVLDDTTTGYGDPSFFDLPNESLPFAFVWRSGQVGTDKQIVLIVNIAGENLDYPQCSPTTSCRSSVTTLEVDIAKELGLIENIRRVDDVNLNIVDGCWIDYRFSHWYTGNFVSDTISIGTVTRDGGLTWERNVPTGSGTVPNDVVHMGRKIDGSLYLYSENQGTAEIGIHRVIESDDDDGTFQLQVKVGAPIPSGETGEGWAGANGLAATTLSEMGLYEMYDYEYVVETGDGSNSHQHGTDTTVENENNNDVDSQEEEETVGLNDQHLVGNDKGDMENDDASGSHSGFSLTMVGSMMTMVVTSVLFFM